MNEDGELADLADSELRRRLRQRGIDNYRCEELIRLRDDPTIERALRRALGWDPS